MSTNRTVSISRIGAGRIGSFNAESVARRLVDARLIAIADPAPGAAEKLASTLGAPQAAARAIFRNELRRRTPMPN